MTADILHPILGMGFLSALGLVIYVKHRVLLNSTVHLQARDVCTWILSLGISRMILQSPFSSILNKFLTVALIHAFSSEAHLYY